MESIQSTGLFGLVGKHPKVLEYSIHGSNLLENIEKTRFIISGAVIMLFRNIKKMKVDMDRRNNGRFQEVEETPLIACTYCGKSGKKS